MWEIIDKTPLVTADWGAGGTEENPSQKAWRRHSKLSFEVRVQAHCCNLYLVFQREMKALQECEDSHHVNHSIKPSCCFIRATSPGCSFERGFSVWPWVCAGIWLHAVRPCQGYQEFSTATHWGKSPSPSLFAHTCTSIFFRLKSRRTWSNCWREWHTCIVIP